MPICNGVAALLCWPVTKPFDVEELLARVYAVLRRIPAPRSRLVLGSVTVDFGQQKVVKDGNELQFTRREFDLLRYLSERQGRVVLRDELLREVWGYRDPPITRSVDNAIVRLRRKIETDAHHPRFIHTVHGGGYCLTVPSADQPKE